MTISTVTTQSRSFTLRAETLSSAIAKATEQLRNEERVWKIYIPGGQR